MKDEDTGFFVSTEPPPADVGVMVDKILQGSWEESPTGLRDAPRSPFRGTAFSEDNATGQETGSLASASAELWTALANALGGVAKTRMPFYTALLSELVSADARSRVFSTRSYRLPASLSESVDEDLFRRLVKEWKAETALTSSVTEKAMHQAYQQIIGMGPGAIPLILSQLEKDPDHWFCALRSISRDDPVRPESRGDLRKMTRDWLDWGRSKGIVWRRSA